jgi:hypothetical protein
MPEKRQIFEPTNEFCELMKKNLILSLFKMDLPQIDIAKKLHMDIHAVNDFLKGIKKQ